MNTTYYALEVKRIVRDPAGLFFTAGLPAVMYLIFGAAQSYKDEDAVNGNVGLFIAISMAAYGAVTATTGVGGTAAVERMQGWGRQLGLTPLRDSQYVLVKAAVAATIAVVPIALIYVLAVLTGAEGSATAWLVSGLIVLLGAGIWALYGLAIAQAFRSESAVSVASGMLVVLAFLGNIFFPLSGTMLTIAKFTPLYGYVQLARYPLTEGAMINNSSGSEFSIEPLWVPLLNLTIWSAIFALGAVALVRRGRGRQ
ncbi:ABC transporter permease [Demetria terragena]|uniref:ABC transporter permease n=1 Tax=Demetria terragena TaxID=63959 RepID=UPI000380B388|nr:ABC transporter permease [Demetria terragena]